MTTTTSTTKRAIGYVRVSTADQADSGAGLDAQRAKLAAWCELHDADLVELIEDAGMSAKTLDRPGMSRVLEAVTRRSVDVVVVAKLDRLTRSVRDLGELVETFNRSGVQFASVADQIDTGTASGRLVLNVMGSVSQWEREAIAERTSEALTAMKANGRRVSRHAPFGFRHVGRELVPDEREQAAISVIRDLRADGWSLRQIAAELEQRGVLGRNGRRVSPTTIGRVLERAA